MNTLGRGRRALTTKHRAGALHPPTEDLLPAPPKLPRLAATLAACAAPMCLLASAPAPALAAADDPAFTSAPDLTLAANTRPSAIAAGDFDSDGNQDLVIADFDSEFVR